MKIIKIKSDRRITPDLLHLASPLRYPRNDEDRRWARIFLLEHRLRSLVYIHLIIEEKKEKVQCVDVTEDNYKEIWKSGQAVANIKNRIQTCRETLHQLRNQVRRSENVCS